MNSLTKDLKLHGAQIIDAETSGITLIKINTRDLYEAVDNEVINRLKLQVSVPDDAQPSFFGEVSPRTIKRMHRDVKANVTADRTAYILLNAKL